MIKSVKKSVRSERQKGGLQKMLERRRMASVQNTIPIDMVFKDGMLLCNGKYSKSWQFLDINYSVASQEAKAKMLSSWCDIINSLPADASTKVTVNNHRLNQLEFRKKLSLRRQNDGLDEYRKECEAVMFEKASGSSRIVQERYITISTQRKTPDEAQSFFARINNELTTNFSKMASRATELPLKERMRILHDFFRSGEEVNFMFDLKDAVRKGNNFKDSICPDSIAFKADHFEMGERFGRVLFLREYASYIKDDMLAELTDFPRNMMLSIDMLPILTDEAAKKLASVMLAVDTDIARWQRRQNDNSNFSAHIPYDLEQAREEAKEFLDNVTRNDQRILAVAITLVHTADSLEDLNADTETLMSIGRKRLCNFSVLRFQQEDGLNTVLPYGIRPIETMRNMTSESLSILTPFKTQEIQDIGGVYYGVNAVSRNPLICNRKGLLNGNGFILGISGSGKSFSAKQEITNVALSTDDDIIVIDPEREYAPLIRALGGEVVHISATSRNHINAMDLPRDTHKDDNPIVIKTEFLMSFCETIVGELDAKQRSLIGRCVTSLFHKYINGESETVPTLAAFSNELKNQTEIEAHDLAVSIELFTEGALDVFAHPTNVNIDSRIILFDILDLGKHLKNVGLLVMLDAMLNRVIANRRRGKNTWVYIDEIYLLFANEYSSNFLMESWKRFRKYGALATGITQNVEDCLRSVTARTMLANSEFLLMLSQSATDRAELSKLMNISETQMGYITTGEPGRGLIRMGMGNSLVPFRNEFPSGTRLHSLMSTKPGEGALAMQSEPPSIGQTEQSTQTEQTG